jgi:hypothetical protein
MTKLTEPIQRYSFPSAEGYPAFDMVSYADHLAALAKAEAELDALKVQLSEAESMLRIESEAARNYQAENASLRAQVARLTEPAF